MRIGNLDDRLVILTDDGAIDVETASGGRFSREPQAVYDRWAEFREWETTITARHTAAAYSRRDLGPAVPRPPQVFAIGLNYASHAGESGFAVPDDPIVFTKFVSSFGGAEQEVVLTGDRVDWEAELVAVIGTGGRDIAESEAWEHIAGLTVGQDLSDRDIQFWGHPPQFSLGKSAQGFTPIGPWVSTLDEVGAQHDVLDLRIRCIVRDSAGQERMLQDGSTRDMIFPIPALVARLSSVVELLPGDVIFSGTPAGVGVGRDPQEFLRAGDDLRTEIDGIGSIVQRFVARSVG